MNFDRIPIIDMGPSQSDFGQLAHDLRKACHQVGFFYIANHGVPEARCAAYLDAAKRFFDLPQSQKQLIHKQHSPHFRGWEQLGSELTNNEVDHREQLDLGSEREALINPHPYYMRLVGPNQWPVEAELPGFRKTVLEYMGVMERLSRRLLRALSASLGLSKEYIEDVFGKHPMPYCKLIRYPVTPRNQSGVGAHKDAGFLSVLLQDGVGGLQAQNGSGQWVDVPPVPGTFAVNLGEMLQIMTRNYYVATPHRVINRDTARDRYSLGYFYNPDLNTRLGALPLPSDLMKAVDRSEHHARAGLMASREEMSRGVGGMKGSLDDTAYGYKYWQRWVRSYPDIVSRHHPDLPQ